MLSFLLVPKQSKPINAIGNPLHIFEAEVPGVCEWISGDRTSNQFESVKRKICIKFLQLDSTTSDEVAIHSK